MWLPEEKKTKITHFPGRNKTWNNLIIIILPKLAQMCVYIDASLLLYIIIHWVHNKENSEREMQTIKQFGRKTTNMMYLNKSNVFSFTSPQKKHTWATLFKVPVCSYITHNYFYISHATAYTYEVFLLNTQAHFTRCQLLKSAVCCAFALQSKYFANTHHSYAWCGACRRDSSATERLRHRATRLSSHKAKYAKHAKYA